MLPLSSLFSGILHDALCPLGWFSGPRELSELPGKEGGEQVRKHQEGRTKKGGDLTQLRNQAVGESTGSRRRERQGDSDQERYCSNAG